MNGKNLVLYGGIGLVVGALLPWGVITSMFGSLSINGFEGDGAISGFLGIVLFIIALTKKPKPDSRYSIFAGLIALLAGYIVVNTMFNIGSFSDGAGVYTQTGVGLYVSVVSAFLGLLGGFIYIPKEEPVIEAAPKTD